MPTLFDQITFNVAAGTIAYPKLDGFVLDHERMYATAKLFAAHCGSVEMALRQAIHLQLVAYQGLEPLRRAAGTH